MAGIRLTYDIAMAASRDAGNRSMRAAGRAVWNDEDYNACVARQDHLAMAFARANYPELGDVSQDVAFMLLAETRGMNCIAAGR